MGFPDRSHAGAPLADTLRRAGVSPDVVLGSSRGGIPGAFEVASSFAVAPDVIAVRRLGVPFQPELAMGALADFSRVSDSEVRELVARVDTRRWSGRTGAQ